MMKEFRIGAENWPIGEKPLQGIFVYLRDVDNNTLPDELDNIIFDAIQQKFPHYTKRYVNIIADEQKLSHAYANQRVGKCTIWCFPDMSCCKTIIPNSEGLPIQSIMIDIVAIYDNTDTLENFVIEKPFQCDSWDDVYNRLSQLKQTLHCVREFMPVEFHPHTRKESDI